MHENLGYLGPDPEDLFYDAVMNSGILAPDDLQVEVEQDGERVMVPRTKNEIRTNSYKKVEARMDAYIGRMRASRYLNSEDRHDIRQYAWREIFKKISEFDLAQGTLKTWIWNKVRCSTTTVLREIRQIRGAFPQSGDNIDDLIAVDEVADPAGTLESLESQANFVAAFERLPARYCTVCLMCYDRGMSHGEIAQALTTSEDNVRHILHRAKIRLRADVPLRKYLEDLGYNLPSLPP